MTHARSARPVKFPKHDQPTMHGARVATLACIRYGFQLGDGFCVTDYYAQGLSFRDEVWFAHLCRPDTGALRRASVLVTLTRFADWDRVLAWTPLWPATASEKDIERVIDAFHRAAAPSPDLLAEMDRVREAAMRTRADFPDHLRALVNELHPPAT